MYDDKCLSREKKKNSKKCENNLISVNTAM